MTRGRQHASPAGDPAEIDKVVDGETTVSKLWYAARHYPDMPAISWRAPDGGWTTYSWAAVRSEVLAVGAGLVDLGLRPDEPVAIMAPNVPEHILADQGVVHAGGLPFTVYATSAPEQIEFLVRHSATRFVILHGHAELERWMPVLERMPAIERVIMIEGCPDGERFLPFTELLTMGRAAQQHYRWVIEARCERIGAQDSVALVYTSGTTGDPKGVLLTHYNVLYKAESWRRNAGVPTHPVSVSYLPYAHIAERVNGMYVPLHLAGHVHFCAVLAELPEVLAEVRPHSLTAVPRVWEKLRARLDERLGTDGAPDAERVRWAVGEARSYMAATENGGSPSAELVAEYRRAEREVLIPLRRIIGLDQSVWCASSAAPAEESTDHYFAGLGIRLSSVYGMTETTGGITVNLLESFRSGTVGRMVAGCEARVAEDGELLVRGPLVTPGYYRNPEATGALFDERGWAHTGDLGAIDEDGYLTIVGRKKELLVTAGGENVPPRRIEELLLRHPVVSQAMACGDGRRYITALIAVSHRTMAESDTEVNLRVAAAVSSANRLLAKAHQIKKWCVVTDDWSVETGELTPTFKLRRQVIEWRHAELIDGMYARQQYIAGSVP